MTHKVLLRGYYTHFRDPDGEYRVDVVDGRDANDPERRTVQYVAPDGIHYTRTLEDFLADVCLECDGRTILHQLTNGQIMCAKGVKHKIVDRFHFVRTLEET